MIAANATIVRPQQIEVSVVTGALKIDAVIFLLHCSISRVSLHSMDLQGEGLRDSIWQGSISLLWQGASESIVLMN